MNTRIPILAAALFFASACDSGDPSEENGGLRELVVSVADLDPLPSGYHYEGWAQVIEDDEAVERSTGPFNLNTEGDLVDISGAVVVDAVFRTDFDLEPALTFSITIEPDGQSDGRPSDTRLMGGDFREFRAELATAHEYGIDDRLATNIGTYILSTPTNGPNTHELSGIWFINMTGGSFARGLQIEFPVDGWNYQGWTEFDGIPVTTGIVRGYSSADDSSPYSGPLAGYDYPGEDFLTNAPSGLIFPTAVTGSPVYVTIEPDPDPDPGASALRLFSARVPTAAMDSVTYLMDLNYPSFPTGLARIRSN